MAAVGTFVPTYQGLSAVDFLRLASPERRRRDGGRAATPLTTAFPMNAPGRIPFYRCRNAIYHLFRELIARKPGLTVIAPDYNSGNEILALRAAGARIRYCRVDRRMQMDPQEIEQICRN